MKEIFAFLASGHMVGVEASDVYRVVDNCEITPVPLMPPFYVGIVYYRGELFDVLDAGSVLYSTRPRGFQGNRRIVLLKWKGRSLALIPDAVKGLLQYAASGECDETIQLIHPESIRERALELYG
jgi:chemotaxis signal transduction protein